MKQLIFVAAIVLAAACNNHITPSTTPIANAEIISSRGDTILAGHCSLSAFEAMPYKQWFDHNYNTYATDTATIEQLKPLLTGKTIEVFLGTWCGDSKREVPRMMKILQQAHIDTTQVKLILVDHAENVYKQSPQHEEQGKNIHHVPTFIIYENNREKGRIVETPVVTLEKDLLSILTTNTYRPNYKAITYWHDHVKGRNKIKSDTTLKAIAAAVKPVVKHLGEYNAYGYVLLAQHRYKEAINVLTLNTLLFPDQYWTYNSLADVYYKTGDNTNARKYYQKVLTLKPDNNNAKDMLKKIP